MTGARRSGWLEWKGRHSSAVGQETRRVISCCNRTRTARIAACVVALCGLLCVADVGRGAGIGERGGSGVEALLAQIPASRMPAGQMTEWQEKSFRRWAAATLSGQLVRVRFVAGTVRCTDDGVIVVTGHLPVLTPVHGRIVLCRLRAELAASAAASDFAGLDPGEQVTVVGETPVGDPLYPARGKIQVSGAEQAISGWTADRAYLGLNLENCRAPGADHDPFHPGSAPRAGRKPQPKAVSPAAKPAKKPATPATAPKKPAAKPKREPTTFFKVSAGDATRIIYVVDRSGSMTDSIDYVKFELKRSIARLTEAETFHVVFYSSGPPLEMPTTRRTVARTDDNGATHVRTESMLPKAMAAAKAKAYAFIDGVIPQGETDPSKALERAFQLKPGVVFILTDGEFDRAVADLLKRLNPGAKVPVHTLGFLYRTGETLLKRIAADSGGQYRFVSEADLATLAN
jgi:hypothetical protein